MSKRPARSPAEIVRDRRRKTAERHSRASVERLDPLHPAEIALLLWHVSRYPLAGLLSLSRLRDRLRDVEAELVVLARANGIPWEDVAWSLGLTRQAAVNRHPNADDVADEITSDGRGALAAALVVMGEDEDL